MRNPLSQAEIDALMQRLLPTSGEESLFQPKGGVVRDYDFRRPGKFNKDSLHTLVVIHDNFARLAQGMLSASLRTRIQSAVRTTNQYTYGEYMQLLPNPTVVAKFEMSPLPGVCLVELSHNVAYAIVERVFGGHGGDSHPQRALSEIEVSIVQRMVHDLFAPLQEAWRNVAEVKPVLQSVETNPVFLQTGAPSEVVVAITVGIDISEHKGHMTLVFPFSTVEPVLAQLSAHRWHDTARVPKPEELKLLRHSVEETELHVSAVLGKSQVSIGQFLELKVGDLILLESRVNEPVGLYVGDRLVCQGRPGVVGKHMSVQVTRIVPQVKLPGQVAVP